MVRRVGDLLVSRFLERDILLQWASDFGENISKAGRRCISFFTRWVNFSCARLMAWAGSKLTLRHAI